MKHYRELIVWQKSMDLVEMIYKIDYLNEERFGLSSQIRRSSISIPSNIAEGYGRNSTKDYIRFLQISKGSLYELQTQLEISYRLKYIDTEFDRIYQISQQIDAMLQALINSLKKYL